MMDQDRRLELIAMLAQDKAWDAIVLIGTELLDAYYPADVFTGVSDDPGPTYVVALRNALTRIEKGIDDKMTSATHEERLGDAPIEPEFRAMMNELAADLDTLLNPGPQSTARTTGFVLLVFPFEGREGRANYISNANRAGVVTLLKEQLARFEGQEQP